MKIDCFKAYDVRGRLPDQINDEIAYRIGRAYAQVIKPKRVAVGYDIRLSSPELCASLVKGLREEGVDVLDIGCCGTEEIYFSTPHLHCDGGIVVTASHNPKDYNGMKFVKEEAKPIHADNGLLDIREVAQSLNVTSAVQLGTYQRVDTRQAYIEHLLSYVDVDTLKPFKIVANPGNGGAGMILNELKQHLPFEFVMLHAEPDGHFPNGVPNPLLEENRGVTQRCVIEHQADFGIAWDGDFDRCFFFDEKGRFIEGYYLVGLLAEFFLAQQADDVIVHDPRLYWNTQSIANAHNTRAVQSKTGHAYMKSKMREYSAVYGGEMSAHHYFRDFYYCDSGMIPWLLIAALLSSSEQTLSSLLEACQLQFPVSGEINLTLNDPIAAIAAVEQHYSQQQPSKVDATDGISLDFEHWRFNLRCSNTEPVVRLNVESRGDPALMAEKRDEILTLLKAF